MAFKWSLITSEAAHSLFIISMVIGQLISISYVAVSRSVVSGTEKRQVLLKYGSVITWELMRKPNELESRKWKVDTEVMNS